jgi:hypothetical protein
VISSEVAVTGLWTNIAFEGGTQILELYPGPAWEGGEFGAGFADDTLAETIAEANSSGILPNAFVSHGDRSHAIPPGDTVAFRLVMRAGTSSSSAPDKLIVGFSFLVAGEGVDFLVPHETADGLVRRIAPTPTQTQPPSPTATQTIAPTATSTATSSPSVTATTVATVTPMPSLTPTSVLTVSASVTVAAGGTPAPTARAQSPQSANTSSVLGSGANPPPTASQPRPAANAAAPGIATPVASSSPSTQTTETTTATPPSGQIGSAPTGGPKGPASVGMSLPTGIGGIALALSRALASAVAVLVGLEEHGRRSRDGWFSHHRDSS